MGHSGLCQNWVLQPSDSHAKELYLEKESIWTNEISQQWHTSRLPLCYAGVSGDEGFKCMTNPSIHIEDITLQNAWNHTRWRKICLHRQSNNMCPRIVQSLLRLRTLFTSFVLHWLLVSSIPRVFLSPQVRGGEGTNSNLLGPNHASLIFINLDERMNEYTVSCFGSEDTGGR